MDKKTIEAYDRFAVEYDTETAGFWNKFPRTFLDAFIEASGTKVLDVGSGPGRDGLLIQKASKDVTCIDASDAMVRLSRERGLLSVKGTFDTLPFPDESFDGVWSYTAFLHIPKSDIGAALSEAHRVLAPNGIFALGMIEGEGEGYRDNISPGVDRWFSYYTENELRALVPGCGFEEFRFERF